MPLHALDPTPHTCTTTRLLDASYAADEENERLAKAGLELPEHQVATGLGAMRAVLQQRGYLCAGVEAELDAGMEYWAAERRLCAWMHVRPVVPADGHASAEGLTEEAVLQASEDKSFDYRVSMHASKRTRWHAQPQRPVMLRAITGAASSAVRHALGGSATRPSPVCVSARGRAAARCGR